jgi:hypothetical protein
LFRDHLFNSVEHPVDIYTLSIQLRSTQLNPGYAVNAHINFVSCQVTKQEHLVVASSTNTMIQPPHCHAAGTETPT